MQNILFFGYGYVAMHTTKLLLSEGFQITGTTRSAEKLANTYKQKGVELIIDKVDIIERIKHADHLVISAAPSAAIGDPIIAEYRAALLSQEHKIKTITYLSATSVYGDHKGAWVNEGTTPTPNTTRGELRLEAESAWQELAAKLNTKCNILRLSGIYGPKRNALISIADGSARSIFKEGQVFSRIHVDDIANVILAVIKHQGGQLFEIYNLADDEPASVIDINEYTAQLMQLAPPIIVPFENAELTPMGQEFYTSCRRVRNDKIKQLLKPQSLQYNSYRKGLKSLLDSCKF